MDLALELGMTVRELERRMSERELSEWAQYKRERLFPTQRMEVYLAQVTFAIAKSAGSKATSLTDFLIEFGPPPVVKQATAKEHAEMLSGITGKGVIVLGQKRREREKRRANGAG